MGIKFAIVAMLVPIAGCAFPTNDQSKLKAIRAEAMVLMATYPIDPEHGWSEVPRSRLPPAIASLRPKRVAVYKEGVDILIRSGFDGGWGYEIPQKGERLAMREDCYSQPGPGVFWHGPCDMRPR